MKNVTCSLFVIVNNEIVFTDFFANLKKQKNIDYKLIKIENKNNEYDSARYAYNSYAQEVDTDYLVFLHPDIRFLDNNSLSNIIRYIDDLTDVGVVGIAGCPQESLNNDRIIYSTIVHGENKKEVGIGISEPREVQTVDECFFVMKRSFFDECNFTDRKGWHLYAVEQCLRANLLGKKNYVVPANVWHISDGKSLDSQYVVQVKLLLQEYSSHLDYINTTVRRWKTKGIFSKIYLQYYYLKQKIKRFLMK